MAYKVIILYQLYMPSYFLGTFTEYPYLYFCFIKKCFYLWNVYSMIMLNEIRILQNRSYKGLFECWLY